MTALRDLGHDVYEVNYHQPGSLANSLAIRMLPRRLYELTLHKEASSVAARLLEAVSTRSFDVIWLEWPRLVSADVVERLRRLSPMARVVSFQDDNPFGLRVRAMHGWSRFLQAIPAYDCHYVKRDSDKLEYHRLGARRVCQFNGGHSERLFFREHRDPTLPEWPVTFVGSPLDDRLTFLEELIVRYKIPVQIFGNRWEGSVLFKLKPELFHPAVLGNDYRRVVVQSDISLGFVSQSNRDEWTMRSFEITACGGFLLAKRTQAHRRLYLEGAEAEFFDSPAECAQKISTYLSSPEKRHAIARQGLIRSQQSGYGLMSRMAEALSECFQ